MLVPLDNRRNEFLNIVSHILNVLWYEIYKNIGTFFINIFIMDTLGYPI
jgi:hypothetical protein